MKFSEHLQTHLTPEWRTQYINYQDLKVFLYDCASEIERWNGSEYFESLQMDLESYDSIFFNHCAQELEKVSNFYTEKLSEAKRKYMSLLEDLEKYTNHTSKQRKYLQSDFIRSLTSLATGVGPSASRTASRLMSRKNSTRSEHSMAPISSRRSEDDNGVAADVANVDVSDVGVLPLHSYMHQRKHRDEVTAVDSSSTGGSVAQQQPVLKDKHNTAGKHEGVKEKLRNKRKHQLEQKRHVKTLHSIKLSFSEFYLSLILIQNYQSLNYIGFRKILKKHDKLLHRDTGLLWRMGNVDIAPFNTDKTVDSLIRKVEDIYAEEMERGDRSRAMKRLRVPPLSDVPDPVKTYKCGLFFGIFSMMAVVIVLTLVFVRQNHVLSLPWRLCQIPLMVGVYITLLGCNMYAWRCAGVNHVLIFEINPRNHATHHDLFVMGGAILVLWGTTLLCTLYGTYIGLPMLALPPISLILLLAVLFNPLPYVYYKSRRWIFKVLKRVMLAPFYPVKFADFWMADQMLSLSPLLAELAFLVCFYVGDMSWADIFVSHLGNSTTNTTATIFEGIQNSTYKNKSLSPPFNFSTAWNLDKPSLPCCWCSSPMRCPPALRHVSRVLLVLPAWFSTAQCLRRYRDMKQCRTFPHLMNAGKYSTYFVIALFATFANNNPRDQSLQVLFVLAHCVFSGYNVYWDTVQDWGLLNSWKRETWLLRDMLVYRHRAYYYLALVLNLLLRLVYALQFVLFGLDIPSDVEMYSAASRGGAKAPAFIMPLHHALIFLEIFRRFLWNFFRLENEHLSNCGEFRAVRNISVRPIQRRSAATSSEPYEGKSVIPKSLIAAAASRNNNGLGDKTTASMSPPSTIPGIAPFVLDLVHLPTLNANMEQNKQL